MAQAGRTKSPHDRARGDDGAVIVVMLMVLLAVAGISLVGVRTSFHEIRSAANQALAALSYSVTDGGTAGTISTAAADPSSFITIGYSNNMTVTALHIGLQDTLWDTSQGGSLGFHAAVLGTPLSWTQMEQPIALDFFPGSSTGEFCAEKHTWNTHGAFGDTAAYPTNVIDPTGGSTSASSTHGEKVIMTRWLVGPIDCSGGNQ